MNNKWVNAKSLIGKTVAITGATGGIGTELCHIFAGLNANLILINRNLERSNKLKAELLNINPNINIEIYKTDLEDLNSVKQTAEALRHTKIDVLILNAGAYKIKRKTTPLGFDNLFQINFISQYFLVKKLIKNLKQASQPKVVAVGSIAHAFSSINLADIDFSKVKSDSKTYGNAKRFLMFSLFELLKNQNIEFAVAHPGITPTNITSNYSKTVNAVIKYPMKAIFMKPEKACISIVEGVFNPQDYGTWVGPKNFNIWGKPKVSKLKTFSETESKRIYDIAEKIYTKIKIDIKE
jgi:short-subunit dehydrogenase